MEEYELTYRKIYQYAYPLSISNQPSKTEIGDRENRVCMFCNRTSSETTFKKIAHIIPAALGNRTLFSNSECDECNENIFSLYENDLMNLLQIDRILVRGRARRGGAKYKPANKDSYITSTPDTNQVEIFRAPNEEDTFTIEEKEPGIGVLKYLPLSYNYVGVCKTLVHIGFSVLGAKILKKYPYVNQWLSNNIEILPLYIDKAFIPGSGLANVIFEVLESCDNSTEQYPLLFRLSYGFTVLTFYLPLSADIVDSPKRFMYLENVPDKVEIKVDALIINKNEKETPSNGEYTFRYSHIERNK